MKGLSAALAAAILGACTQSADPAPPPPPATDPAPQVDPIDRLIERLGSDDPAVRDAAEAELGRRGEAVVPNLERAGESPDPEVRLRARALLARIRPAEREPLADPERHGIRAEDTGAVMFICADPTAHEECEVEIETCPSCESKNFFFYDPDLRRAACFKCRRYLPAEKIVCPMCRKPPARRFRIKHR
jgi:RNA polymerase subunit RPABC4/transcription elongation factor Spt4